MKLLLQFDRLHNRIDLQRPTAHVLTIAVAMCWAIMHSHSFRDIAGRFIAILIFLMALRLILSRAGASRLAAFGLLLAIWLMASAFTLSEVVLLGVIALVMLLLQEYFILRSKLVAVGAALFIGILLAGMGDYADRVFLLVSVVLAVRVLWHAVIERMGRKVFILFSAKAVAMVLVSLAVWRGLQSLNALSFDMAVRLPEVQMPLWLAVAVFLLAVRGLWATLLLKTKRSPQHRGMRLFYMCFGAAVLAVVAWIQAFGDQIFLPTALHTIRQWGMADYNLTAVAYSLLATGLLVTAGLDRSLYKDGHLGRALRPLLTPPTEQVRDHEERQ